MIDFFGNDTEEMARKIAEERSYGASGGSDNRGILTKVKVKDLPDEAFDAFSDAPFDFEETAQMLWEDTQKVYYHACTANRFTDKYLRLCGQLEKNIKELGSWCITKAVLEHEGIEFPKLDDMNIDELVRMVSFHLRKTHAALEGIYQDNDLLGMAYLDWELRWVSLGKRLKATEVKIQKIRDGRIDFSDRWSVISDQGAVVGDQKAEAGDRKVSVRRRVQSLRLNPNAFPIQGSMARDMLRREIAFSREQRRLWREKERAEGGKIIPPHPTPVKFVNEAEEEARRKERANNPPPGMITEGEARRELIEKALKEGDQRTVMAIQTENSEVFRERWMKYLESCEEEDQRASRRAEPSNDTRKKLREKRKKRK